MDWTDQHAHRPDASFDGGDLDCGNGLLLLIRRHLDPLHRGQLLEIVSSESSVEEDLPAWSRLTGNELLSRVRHGARRSYLVCKGKFGEVTPPPTPQLTPPLTPPPLAVSRSLPPTPTEPLPLFPVLSIGSWPRPRWLLQSLHDYLESRLPEPAFHETADDAVRLAVAAQQRAGVDVLTDGEQRRDSYASFIGSRLACCQLVPITDLLPYVDDPAEFEAELRSLDVPAELVRHPAVLKPLRRDRPLALHEARFLRQLTDQPVKIALPGPYLLTRTLHLECVSERVYRDRDALARDVVQLLREETADLLADGVALVQFDEPVLTEVVFGRPKHNRSFMCGALSDRRGPAEELAFASSLFHQVAAGFPADRLGLHVCRGNWSRDEGVALEGDYAPLMPLLSSVPVGHVFLETCTPRAGEWDRLRDLPSKCKVGVGVVNQKLDAVEEVDAIVRRAEAAVALFGPERVMLNPDCGFATFADNPVSSADVAERKLAAIVAAARILRQRHA